MQCQEGKQSLGRQRDGDGDTVNPQVEAIEQAKKNLQEQIPAWNFDKIKSIAKARWNEVLGQIQVEGGTLDQKRVFYTSLYRCYERMVNITEDGQYYSAFDHKVHQDARPDKTCGMVRRIMRASRASDQLSMYCMSSRIHCSKSHVC